MEITQVRGTPTIQMGSGIHIHLEHPLPETILPRDMGHALAFICRFGGHVSSYYSVAQHSMNVAHLAYVLSSELPERRDPIYKLYGMAHEWSEAILGSDVPSPVKRLPCNAGYKILQDVHMAAVAERLGLPRGFEKDPVLKRADMLAEAVEARDLMGDPGWARDVDRPLRDLQPPLRPMGPEAALAAYMDMLRSVFEETGRS